MFAVAWIVQLVPSQASASVALAPPLGESDDQPTALHMVADTHDTPSSVLFPVLGVGTLWMVQLVPSQRSANGTSVPTPFT